MLAEGDDVVLGPHDHQHVADLEWGRRGGELDGLTLREAGIRERFHCTVLALRHAADNRLDSHPAPTAPLEVGDVLVVMGSEDDVVALREHYAR